MKSVWRILRFTKELWPFYVTVSILSVLVALITQAIPLLTKVVIDHISKGLAAGTVDLKPVIIIAICIFACDFGQALLGNLNGHIGDILSAKLQRLLSTRYYEHVLSLPQRYFDTEISGKIINRLNRGVARLSDFMQFFTNNFLQLIFSMVISIAVVAYFAWPIALILIALFPIYGFMTVRSSPHWQKYQEKVNGYEDQAIGRFTESIGQIKVVKSFAKETRELGLFDSLMEKMLDSTRPQSRYWHGQDMIRRTVLSVMFLAMYIIIFVGTARGDYTLGTMVLLLQYIQLVRLPLFSITFYVERTQDAIANSKDYFAALEIEPEVRDEHNAKPLRVPDGAIEFRDVTFGYEDAKPVLRGVSFTVEPDSKVALVGESGQGKTTITNLLLRFYEPQSGTVTIDGQDLRNVQQSSLRSRIAVVFQEPALFSGTIRDNIAYARPGAKQVDVVAAAKAANAHEFIEGFEKGYSSEIGERGLKLSGGQKQRIAIARALLKDAPILILDEATSSLDTRSERLVQEALERLMKGRTTIIIAHRLSTIQSVDTIVCLENGTISEIGSPNTLAHSGGVYAQLLQLQQSHTEAGKEQLKRYEMKED